MKILLKITAIIIVVIIALLFILPIIYKAELSKLAKEELNKNVNATINFEDIDLSLIKNFPNFNLSVYKLIIVGKNDFHDDTLANIKSISLTIDLFSVLKSDNYELKKIVINEPNLNVKVLKNGKANYDISLPAKNDFEESPSGESPEFILAINKFQINNGQLTYADEELDVYANIKGLNHTLSGKLGSDDAILTTKTRIANLNVSHDGISYLTNVAAVYKANIDADMKNEIYTLGKNELIINELKVIFDGLFSFVGDDNLNIVLTFKSQDNKFKNILSLVPIIYSNDFSGVTADGSLSVNGSVNGVYNDDNLPSFKISLKVENGMFKYPDLPKSVSGINISSLISNKGGVADNTIIDISKFNLKLGENPLSASFKITTPVSDPNLKAKIAGKINLNSIKDFYPLDEKESLSGNIVFDVIIDGKLSSIEEEKYEEFSALGFIHAKNINYHTADFNEAVNISNAQLNFSPAYLDLISFKATIGNNDLSANGKIENYLAYYFNNATLCGTLNINSNYLNIDELFAEAKAETNTSSSNGADTLNGSSEISAVVEIPDNVNFGMFASLNKLVYDSIEMEAVNGKLILKDKTLQIQNLKMNAVEGKMMVNGSYSTADVENPKVDLRLNMENLSIPVAYNKFAIIRKYLPMAKKTTGLFSADFVFSTILNSEMMPDYPTLNGDGTLSTTKIEINDLNSLTQIAETLNYDKFRKMEIDAFMVKFQFEDGKLNVNPTNFAYKNIDATIEGWTSFDQTIGYDLDILVPSEELGKDANKLLDEFMTKVNSYGTNFNMPEQIPVNIKIGGTLSKPVITTKFGNNLGASVIDEAKEKVKDEIKEQKEKLNKEAAIKAKKIIDNADKQAKSLIKEAKKQARYIKENATDAVSQLNIETTKQTDALIAEGKKNGFVAELAAKEAAKQLKKESDTQGAEIIKAANKNADELIQEAERISIKLKREAQKQADDILKK